MLKQCWLNAGPASQMVIQHLSRIASTSRVFMSAPVPIVYLRCVPCLRTPSPVSGGQFHLIHLTRWVLLAQFSIYVHKGGQKTFYFFFILRTHQRLVHIQQSATVRRLVQPRLCKKNLRRSCFFHHRPSHMEYSTCFPERYQ